jgi:hypothetical protein
MAGRPTTYTPELGAKVCELIASSASGLRKLSKENDWFPSVPTLLNWQSNHAQFSDQYAQAKRHQLEMLAEDIVDISNDDSLEPNDKRVRIDAIKWLLSKLIPKTYGDKLDLTSGGEALSVSPQMIDARVQSIILAAQARKQHTIGGADLTLSANALKLLD